MLMLFFVAFIIPYCYTEHIIMSSFTDFYIRNFILSGNLIWYEICWFRIWLPWIVQLFLYIIKLCWEHTCMRLTAYLSIEFLMEYHTFIFSTHMRQLISVFNVKVEYVLWRASHLLSHKGPEIFLSSPTYIQLLMFYPAAENGKKIHAFQKAFTIKFSYRLVLRVIKRMRYFLQTITFQNMFKPPLREKQHSL